MNVYPGRTGDGGRYAGGVLVCLIIAVLIFASCGKKETQEKTPIYEGWAKYSYGHFILIISPASRFAADKAELARSFDRFLAEICDILEMPIPEGRILLYVYANPNEAEKLTGRETPFSDDSTIHWAGLYPYGYQLTKFLLHKKGVLPGQFAVLNEGLANLLDFSGANYHDRTTRLYNSGQFAALSRLGNNAAFDSLGGYARRSESASLTGFIMYNYGLDRLLMLNASLAGWKESIEALLHIDIDLVEKNWLDFARGQSYDPKGTVENDTTYKMRIEIDER